MPVTLFDLIDGEIATVHSFIGDMELQSRLVEMGILPGIRIRRIKTAPMNGPIELKVRDYHVSLRQDDARNILIQQ
ncbi:MAG TPA: ferrous iron transport protein A [Candidatus Marinimicrobia bacterium]|nr:ferrous iron transport protein A [Candidatus Neomarinimicrobiota bacterium]HIA91280.1 ferrous iron transport protein A [Candidatus Neomarinimicrobiota bacterium]HIB61149.1 ferrous iron transport protein A [Candidatus Neomarinimicrobiota bacterium]